MSKQWEPVEDGTYWNNIRTRAISVEQGGQWITTHHDGDPGCPVDLSDNVRLMRQVEVATAIEAAPCVPDDVRAAQAEWEPDWSNAPEWAMWHSIDRDGKQHWWEKEPYLSDVYLWWLCSEPGTRHANAQRPPDERGVDWRTTLRRRA